MIPLEFVTNISEILYFQIAIGFVILCHSFYLHRLKWKIVRIINDIAAIALICDSICYLDCYWHSCSLNELEIMYGAIGNGICGLIIQVSDNYMTFARYAAISNVSIKHKILASLWVFVTLILSWWEFFTIFPIFIDMNLTGWTATVVNFNFANFACYILYDGFYISKLLPLMLKSSQVKSTQSDRVKIFAFRALGHTSMSAIGIGFYSFMFPIGMPLQNIMIVTGIHFFLNWTQAHRVISVFKNVYSSGVLSKQGSKKVASIRKLPSAGASSHKIHVRTAATSSPDIGSQVAPAGEGNEQKEI